MVRQIRIARWRRSGKPRDQPFFGGHDRPRFERVKAGEIILLCSIFGTKLIKIVTRKKCPVGDFP
jgi:hypothetical protein